MLVPKNPLSSDCRRLPSALLTRRGWIAGALSAVAVAGCTHGRMPERTAITVLFICQYGTAKSPIAREIFRRMARARHSLALTISRGITLEDHLSPPLRARLVRDGINVDADPLAILAPADWQMADIVVAFNPLPEAVRPRDLRDWTTVPSFNEDYDNGLADLSRRVSALFDTMA